MEELLIQLIQYAADDYSDDQKSFLQMLLDDALDEVVGEMYPYGFSNEKQEQKMREKALKKYKSKIRKIAQYHYDKAGKEGAVGFSENGVSVSYENAGTPSSYLRGIIPVAKVV